MTNLDNPTIPFRARLDEAKLLANPGLRAPSIPLTPGSPAIRSDLRAWVNGLIQDDVILGQGRRKAERAFACDWAATVGPREAAEGAMDLTAIALDVWRAEHEAEPEGEEGSMHRSGRWARSHAILIAFDMVKALPSGESWCADKGSAMIMELLRRALNCCSKTPRQHHEKHEAIELACAMARVSNALGKVDFDELLMLSQPRPLKALLAAEKIWRPAPAEAAAMALAAAKDLASGKLWAIVKLSRISKLAGSASGEEFGLREVDVEELRKALKIACALGAERSVANLLCSWAKPSTELLRECAWTSLGMTELGKKTREGIKQSFENKDCPYTSPADGHAGPCLAQIHGRPLGALLSREEWISAPEIRRELARDIARQALADNNEGLFQLGFFHGAGPRASDLPAAIARFGSKKIAMWEASLVANTTALDAGKGSGSGLAGARRPRL